MSEGRVRILIEGLSDGDRAVLESLCRQEGMDVLSRPEPGAVAVLGYREGCFERAGELAAAGLSVVQVLESRDAARVAPALQAGAVDCLVSPLEAEPTRRRLRRCVQARSLWARLEERRAELRRGQSVSLLAGESPALRAVVAAAIQAADFPVDVVICGETGTGKELLARVLHECSGRAAGPFVVVDCGAINDELADSELFGHRKGAFTGAVSDREGLLSQAQGGTLFLDEVANLSLGVQAKLLRALQNREIWPLGESEPLALDLRVVSASHADLRALAAQGRFRLDLFHRLAGLELTLPPLRRRGRDILLLARLFLARHRERFGKGPCELSPEVEACLLRAAWPGNVRQLDNCMKQAALFSQDRVDLGVLPPDLGDATSEDAGRQASDAGGWELPEGILALKDLEERVSQQVESRLLPLALRRAAGDREEAAKMLGIHPKTLARKLKHLQL